LSGCTSSAPREPSLRISAASSLVDVVPELVAAFLGTHPESIRVEPTYASSSLLARQIEQGAPASVYISADERWLDYLDRHGRLDTATRATIAGNRLVVIVPSDVGSRSEMPAALTIGDPLPRVLAEGKVAVGDPEHVPVGRYAREALERLGWLDALADRLVPARDARAALAYVERGEVAAGIVYATDAASSERVRVIAVLPADAHHQVTYGAAAVEGSDALARSFVAFLVTREARAVLERHGFVVAP
jgi:molybdate transport system substrate-binding protein